MLTAEIGYAYPQGGGLRLRLTCPIQPAGVTVLFGPSGSGKSTLLSLLAGLKRPHEGRIQFGAEVWFDRGRLVPPHRRSAGLLFQDYPLFPSMTVAENIGYGVRSLSRKERLEEVDLWMKRFKLEGKEALFPHVLSGGERQRVALAQTLAARPRLVLLDEPFSALDDPTRVLLRQEVKKWLIASKIPVVMVTHDVSDALALGDTLLILSHGEILQRGAPVEVMKHPASAKVAQIVGIENLLSGTVVQVDGEVLTLESDSIRLVAIGSAKVGQVGFICIRSDEIILERGSLAQTSARNRLVGHVVARVSLPSQVRVVLDCGIHLEAVITGQAADELNLVPGAAVTAVMKASSVKWIPGIPVASGLPPGAVFKTEIPTS